MAERLQFGEQGRVELRGLRGQLVEVVTGAGQNPEHVGITTRGIRDSIDGTQRTRAGQLLADRQHHVAPVQAAQDHAERGERHE